MGVLDEKAWPNFFHPGTAMRWAWVQLMASPEWVAIHDDRTFEDLRITPKTETPFGVVTQVPDSNTLNVGSRIMFGKRDVLLHCFSVRVYPQGQATQFEFVDSYNALINALCERFEMWEVFDDKDRKIGEVWESEFIDDYGHTVNDGDYETVHHGITIRVTFR